MELVLTLVFSIVMLFFMTYPAMLLTRQIARIAPLSDKTFNIVQVLLTVLLSLGVGIFLRYA